MSSLTLPCPAKLNLALSVGEPDATGYHPLASWMVAIDLHDELILTSPPGNDRPNLKFTSDALGQHAINWPPAKDLAYRALHALEDHTGQSLSIGIELHKRIPPGAGLGGGSSDAAGVLVGVNKLLDLKLSSDELCQLAATLGADVAFLVKAIHGSTSAIATGYGEQLTPLLHPKPIHLTLIWPGFGCSTAGVYQAFDALNPQKTVELERVQSLASQTRLDPNAPFNDLAEPAKRVQTQLATVQAELQHKLRQTVHITGSGSALYVIARDAAQARNMTRLAEQIDPCKARAVSTLKSH
ncbi:4-(cytidine 5'-diphospho)-2-C-methyl-D-erythritol kinase [Mucisphaera sp.]|uniref:4-(cytidine 5'-diphospho)-2-C-methyl-D-erythritol kinase n=1 Tax=Mucisphaera sp. TaxID=2913024 RepID=UPI003D143FBE